ncbi:DNA/RNA helicase domain-containing protein [Kordia sp.]|uniref:DNA/RNA helicase domain-containing protein n=1 Tax=Kordia sp. TaxID=1965332 RepID=UPI003D28DD40
MKRVNLLSLIDSFQHLEENIRNQYFNFLGLNFDNLEYSCLQTLVSKIEQECLDIEIFDNYFIGYTIPQIGKEFDLLRFGQNTLVNIELKSESSDEKVHEQLLKNKYYLSFINKNAYFFSYVLDSDSLFCLDEADNLIEVDFKKLADFLIKQDLLDINSINDFFNPTDYLVSPFNSTGKFISNEYFLTNRQNQIKREVITKVDNNEVSLISISGKPGTGKSLLVYDIAKECTKNGKSVLIIHCGILNEGHFELNHSINWSIVAIKVVSNIDINQYDLVVIDEAQRIRGSSFDYILDKLRGSANKSYIFSYDGEQCLHRDEINRNIPQKIEGISDVSHYKFQLKSKIRTNKEVAQFIRVLFDINKKFEKLSTDNIIIKYFKNLDTSKVYMEFLSRNGWKIINYTPSLYNRDHHDDNQIQNEDKTHEVIGQEFDNVVALIDSSFYYNTDGFLTTRGISTYYHSSKMLYQILSRARKRLNIIIVNNPMMMNRCISILGTSMRTE